MMRALALLAGLTLFACGPQPKAEGNDASAANGVEPAVEECAPPTLAMVDGAQLPSALLSGTRANFTAAFQRACAKGVLESKQLIDPKTADKGQLFLINAPEANVASIYLSEVDGNRMVLEYPFLTTDGKTQVPSTVELEEAIYCAVVGATAQEQESTGRCLVD